MTGTITEHQVEGQRYQVWADFIQRATYARNEAGETKRIHGSGYISNDLSIRKAIAIHFGHKSFRK